jgi:hypothetical protein
MIQAGYVLHMGDRRGVYRHLVRMPEGKGLLGRPRHTDGRITILKWIFKKWYVGDMDWIHLWQAVVTVLMNL